MVCFKHQTQEEHRTNKKTKTKGKIGNHKPTTAKIMNQIYVNQTLMKHDRKSKKAVGILTEAVTLQPHNAKTKVNTYH
jgi:hypothetical protein